MSACATCGSDAQVATLHGLVCASCGAYTKSGTSVPRPASDQNKRSTHNRRAPHGAASFATFSRRSTPTAGADPRVHKTASVKPVSRAAAPASFFGAVAPSGVPIDEHGFPRTRGSYVAAGVYCGCGGPGS